MRLCDITKRDLRIDFTWPVARVTREEPQVRERVSGWAGAGVQAVKFVEPGLTVVMATEASSRGWQPCGEAAAHFRSCLLEKFQPLPLGCSPPFLSPAGAGGLLGRSRSLAPLKSGRSRVIPRCPEQVRAGPPTARPFNRGAGASE